MLKRIARFKLTATMCNNVSYLVVEPMPSKKRNTVSYFGAAETPFCLSNIADKNAAELRFALEDAATEGEALKHIRAKAVFAKAVELLS